ncbi:MAG: hypothetical protein GY705_20290 [Bacteroidetes bacterium]|nr:hypothetical protein [Bacteroidota bacterium]
MEALKSEGKCVYCEKMYAKRGITRHLGTHLKKLETENPAKISKAYHLRIDAAEMFLNLLVNGSKPLGELDRFLREIWLECCGHMSSFEVKEKNYPINWDLDDAEFGESMSKRMNKIFRKGMKVDYKYDFGSTTYLQVNVIEEYKLKVPSGVSLLSRNEPLPILCHSCQKKPASQICSIHIYEGESMFCDACAKKHAKECEDFADYAAMEIVNSPRMGVCGYDGGTIDLDRDGVWKG